MNLPLEITTLTRTAAAAILRAGCTTSVHGADLPATMYAAVQYGVHDSRDAGATFTPFPDAPLPHLHPGTATDTVRALGLDDRGIVWIRGTDAAVVPPGASS